MGFFFVALVFFFNTNSTKTWFVNLFFGGMGLYAVIISLKSLEVVSLTEYSLIIKIPFLPEKHISFTDIYSVGDSNASKKLILRDYNGNRLAAISKGIVGVLELKEEIIKRIGDKKKIEVKDYFIKANSYFVSLFLMTSMFVAVLILYAYTRVGSIILLSIYILSFSYLIYSIGKQTIIVRLNDDSIIIINLFKQKVIPIIEIDNIIQKINEKAKNTAATVIVIELKNGKSISLSGFKPDDDLLYQSCKYYLNKNRIAP